MNNLTIKQSNSQRKDNIGGKKGRLEAKFCQQKPFNLIALAVKKILLLAIKGKLKLVSGQSCDSDKLSRRYSAF